MLSKTKFAITDLRHQGKHALENKISWSHTQNLTVMNVVLDMSFFLEYLVRVINDQN